MRPRRLASGRTVQPCTSSETRTTMKAMLNSSRLFGSPPRIGVKASRIETAPRRPTQDRKAVSARGNLKGRSVSVTAAGRAMKIRNSANITAGTRMTPNWLGVANRPSTRNMMICASQDMPS